MKPANQHTTRHMGFAAEKGCNKQLTLWDPLGEYQFSCTGNIDRTNSHLKHWWVRFSTYFLGGLRIPNSHAWSSVCTIYRSWSSAVRDPVLFFLVQIFIYTLSFRCLNKFRHRFPTKHVGSIDSEPCTRPPQWATWNKQWNPCAL